MENILSRLFRKNQKAERVEINRLTSEEYLASLTSENRERVMGIASFIKMLKETPALNGIDFALTAVGSTTKSPDKRLHSPEDIDLRILNSATPETEERERVIGEVRTAVRNYLDFHGMTYEEADNTTYIDPRWVVTTSDGSDSRSDIYISFYNDDPCFIVDGTDNALPLHLSISGNDNWALDDYLKKDRGCVVLLNTSVENK